MSSMNSADIERIHAEIGKLIAEAGKLNAEGRKLNREAFWYPVAVSTGLIGAIATVTTVLVKLF